MSQTSVTSQCSENTTTLKTNTQNEQSAPPTVPAFTKSKKETYLPENFEKVSIYRCAERVLDNAELIQVYMGKKFKFTLGEQLVTRTLEMVDSIAWAYICEQGKEKINLLKEAHKNTLKTLIIHRIAYNRNQIARKIYVEQIDGLVSTLKQLTAWTEKTQQRYEQSLQTN